MIIWYYMMLYYLMVEAEAPDMDSSPSLLYFVQWFVDPFVSRNTTSSLAA